MRARAALGLIALCALVAVLLVPANSVSAVDSDGAPVIANSSATPQSLPYTGGKVHVRAEVTATNGVAGVEANVYDGFRELQTVPLSYEGDVASGDISFGALASTDSAQAYTIVLSARSVPLGGDDALSTEALAGSVAQAAQTATGLPVLTATSVTPQTLPATGGSVAIRTVAGADNGPVDVAATITSGSAAPITLDLKPAGDGSFDATFVAPANDGIAAQEYAVSLTATDSQGGATTDDAGTITVAAPAPAPLQLPDTVAFGSITVGTAGLYGFVLRNTAAPGTPAATGTLQVTGSDYSFAGTDDLTVSYDLPPGESSTVGLTFRPTAQGDRPGTVEVTRAQTTKTQTVTLTGRGT